MRLLPSFFRPRFMFSSVQSTASRKRWGAHLGHSDSRLNLWRRQACLDNNSALREAGGHLGHWVDSRRNLLRQRASFDTNCAMRETGGHLGHSVDRRNLWRLQACLDTNSAMRKSGARVTRKYSRLLYFEPES